MVEEDTVVGGKTWGGVKGIASNSLLVMQTSSNPYAPTEETKGHKSRRRAKETRMFKDWMQR